MTAKLTTIGFDADDTLWQNEQFFRMAQQRFASLLADYGAPDHLSDYLQAAEKRNLGRYGFGIKGFVLSMIETAIEVSHGQVSAPVIGDLLAAGRDMLQQPVELLPQARDCVEQLAASHRILLITKGDLLDQERKLAQSGLGDLFDGVEIVSAKTSEVYLDIFARHGAGPETAMMVGNSMRSDILPVLEIGARGVFVPHHLTWALEHVDPPVGRDRFHEIAHLGLLGELIATL